MKASQTKSFQEYMEVYKSLLLQGEVQKAYKQLMAYLRELRVHFHNKYPDLIVAGNIYQGNMDYTFFSLTSPTLKKEKLKVVILFSHESTEFEVWLVGQNKGIQKKYWELVQQAHWKNCRIPGSIKNTESIVEKPLTTNPDFNQLPQLTLEIERKTVDFIQEVETFLSSL